MNLLHTDSEIAGQSYYLATMPWRAHLPTLDGSIQCDVAIVGGGLAGLSAALELAERGYRVVLLEAHHVGWGASGRNGGQALRGLSCDQHTVAEQLGVERARQIWSMTLEGVDLIRQRMHRYSIDCDWQDGYLYLATSESKHAALMRWADRMERDYGAVQARIQRQDIARWIDSARYWGGLHDCRSGHMHPLKYTLGLASAALQAGARLHERTTVTAVQQQRDGVDVLTESGVVHARQALLAGNVYLQGVAPALEHRIMPVSTYIVCSEPISPALCDALIPSRSAVCDSNVLLDYFRLTPDHRLLYGGRMGYGKVSPTGMSSQIRQRMATTFPQLSRTRIDYAWGGFVDVTMNRAPDFGRLSSSVYYLQGFSGHGLALAGLAGKLVAEAMDGDASRFDVFASLQHRQFPGGRWLRRPAFVLGMVWYRLRDRLG